ncbi:MAG TPA: PLP-dependent aminotransferase family protein [Gaiellaceae bacterium]|nr:PLP-dependent aminotransferase family protein [Gaiellaceae bacterium]
MSPRQLQARELLVGVDRSHDLPVGRQLEDQLRTAIRSGALSAGSDLPSTRALAEDLGVSRGVVVRAYAQLAAAGYLHLRQGANPRVRDIPRTQPAPDPAPSETGATKIRYDLRAHQPEVATFPRQLWLRCVRDALAGATNADLGYVDERGIQRLRIEVADYLGRARGVVADPDSIVVTAGATHALSLISRALARSGSTRMAFENPSHQMLHTVAERAGQTPVGIPVDEKGLRSDMLADVDSVVVSPAHQFPTGVALAADRRAALVGWARRTGGFVLEDDYDAEFRYDRGPIGAVQGLSPEHVAYIGSTGKTLAPAIRLGWAVLPPGLLDEVAAELSTSMLHVAGIDQLAFAEFLRRGEFDRHLRRMRTIYRARRDVLVDALAKHLPDLFVSGIAAGLHVVVELPSRELETAAVEQARSAGVLVQSISQHALPGYDGPPGLLVGYGCVPEPTLPHAVERLALAIHAAARRAA